MTETVACLILFPFAWASLAFLLGPQRGGWIACASLMVQLAAVILAATEGAADSKRMSIGGWSAPLGIELMADGLSVFMLLLTHSVALPIALFARKYFAIHPEGARYFWPLTGFLLAAMNALFLSADLFNLYVTLELISLAAVGLVASGANATAFKAALRYLFASLLGSGAYLLGVALIYGVYGSVSLSVLTPMLATHTPLAASLAACLMLGGLMLKTALFPFHFWLPPAHGGAPAPVSALLSALVIKATFYLILRLWTILFVPLTTPALALLLGVLGTIAIVWGSIMALRQERLKMLVAYSTVAQIGYLFLFFPLAAYGPPEAGQSALQGVAMQAFAHGLAKAAMFASAGAIILSIGHDDIAHFGGISSRLPLTLFTFAIAGVSLMGLPPSSGFIAKWMLIDGAIAGRQWWWVAVVIIGGLLTAAYFFKVLRHAFVRVEQSASFKTLPAWVEWPAFLLALTSLAFGLRATELLNLLGAR